jgi:hypothetical protein
MQNLANRAAGRLLLGLIIVGLGACDPGGSTPVTPQDPIGVSLSIVFGSQTGGSPVTFTYTDPDGPGSAPPVVSAPPLRAGTTFNTVVSLATTERGQVFDRTGTVRDQDTQYQLFFVAAPPSLLQHRYADTDASGLPLGLTNRVETGPPGRGTLRVVVRRALNKRFPNLGPDNFLQAGGVSDTDATFNVVIE